MNKLKQHYDKIILACLLILFILSLLFLLQVSKMPAHVTKAQTDQIEQLQPDYTPLKGTDTQLLTVVSNLPHVAKWRAVEQNRGETDFMFVPEIARCPKCLSLIFMKDYADKKCSRCGADITEEMIVPPTQDVDKDGIPDGVEAEVGTNPKEFDSHLDLDGDSFSNFDEYEYAKASGDFSFISDPKKHPPLNCYLALKEVQERKIDIELTSISVAGRPDPKDWRIYVKIAGRSRTVKVGDKLTIGDDVFTVEGARNDPPPNDRYGAPVPRIRLAFEGRTDKVTVEKGKPTFDPKPIIIFSFQMYASDPKPVEIKTTTGGKFQIGTEHVGFEEVELVRVTDNGTAIIKSLGYEMEISKTAAKAPYAPLKPGETPEANAPVGGNDDILNILRN